MTNILELDSAAKRDYYVTKAHYKSILNSVKTNSRQQFVTIKQLSLARLEGSRFCFPLLTLMSPSCKL